MMRSRFSVLALLVAVAASGTPAGAQIQADFPNVVIFATNSASVSSDAVIQGDVVTNRASTTPPLNGDFEIYVDRKAIVNGKLKGDSIRIIGQATINGDVSFNDLTNSGTINGNQITPLGLPVYSLVPIFRTAAPGTQAVAVPAGGTQTLAAGSYGAVTVGDAGTLILSGGLYSLASLDMGNDTRLLFGSAQPESDLRIAGSFRTRRRAVIGPQAGSGLQASKIVVYVAGADDRVEAARVGSDSTVDANFYARNGTFRMEVNTIAHGAFLARDVQIDRGSRVTLATYFFNRPPVAAADSATVLEDGSVSISVLANDVDPDGDLLTVASVTAPSHGTATTNGITVTYTPEADYFGPDAFTYTVCDTSTAINNNNCVSGVPVSVTVTPVNDPPSFLKGPDQTVSEDAGPQTVSSWATAISAGPANEAGQTVTFLVTHDNAGLFAAAPAVDSAGTLTYTPAADAFGTANVSVRAKDDGGTANGGNDTSAAQTFVITVLSVNDPPVAVDDVATTDEDTPVAIAVKANDTAGPANENQALTVRVVSTTGTADVDGSGTVLYTPAADFFGSDALLYEICDGGQDDDTATDGDDLCATATVAITVDPVDDAPTANSQLVFTDGSQPLLITLTGSDGDGDTLTFSILSGPSHGTLSAVTQVPPSSATVTYTPTDCTIQGGQTVCPADSFTFQASDGLFDASAVVEINSGGDPTPPPPPFDAVVAIPQTVEVTVSEPILPVSVILRGDAPCEGACDGLGNDVPLTFSIVSGPTAGSLGPLTQGSETPRRTASIAYTPPSVGELVATFVFRVEGDVDGSLAIDQPFESATATVTLSIVPFVAPTPPVAENLSVTASAGVDTLVTLSGIPDGGDPTQGRAPALGTRSSGRGLTLTPAGGSPQGGTAEGAGNGAAPARRALRAPVALTVGAGWTATTAVPPAFFWSGTGVVDATDGPFTFTLEGSGCVSLTDDFQAGDRFEAFDNGESIGLTSAVPINAGTQEVGPDAAYDSSTFSSGTFALAAGSHSIAIRVIENPFGGGRGYIRADVAGTGLCGLPQPTLLYTVVSLPAFGTLKTSLGTVITTVPFQLATAEVAFTSSTAGTTSFSYNVRNTLTGLVSNTAVVNVSVIGAVLDNCLTDVTACDDGRLDGNAPVGGAAPAARPGGEPTLTIVVQGSGTVTSNPQLRYLDGGFDVACTGVCDTSFEIGREVALIARPAGERSRFSHWEGDCRGRDPLTVVRVAPYTTCTAVFVEDEE